MRGARAPEYVTMLAQFRSNVLLNKIHSQHGSQVTFTQIMKKDGTLHLFCPEFALESASLTVSPASSNTGPQRSQTSPSNTSSMDQVAPSKPSTFAGQNKFKTPEEYKVSTDTLNVQTTRLSLLNQPSRSAGLELSVDRLHETNRHVWHAPVQTVEPRSELANTDRREPSLPNYELALPLEREDDDSDPV